jgi:hypothetical protein
LVRAEMTAICLSRGRMFKGAIHDGELPLKRVERAHRYRYIGIYDHHFRGQSLDCGRGSWPLLPAATRSVEVEVVGIGLADISRMELPSSLCCKSHQHEYVSADEKAYGPMLYVPNRKPYLAKPDAGPPKDAIIGPCPFRTRLVAKRTQNRKKSISRNPRRAHECNF